MQTAKSQVNAPEGALLSSPAAAPVAVINNRPSTAANVRAPWGTAELYLGFVLGDVSVDIENLHSHVL